MKERRGWRRNEKSGGEKEEEMEKREGKEDI
jgi:hypothetical protein